MKKMKKFVALAAVASLAAATFAGCGKSEGSGSSNTGSDVWKIGSIGPTTGTAAIYGNTAKKTGTGKKWDAIYPDAYWNWVSYD